jgi:acetyl-CoA decarbonylase/synthase complex subunit gamma
MALKALDYFKFTPKTNCKKCGKPTCMAFSMDVAGGKLTIDKCPNIKPEALAKLSEASAPPMKTIKVGVGNGEYKLGGETVLFRHQKRFESPCLYGVTVTPDNADARIADLKKVDYLRIGERMYADVINVEFSGDKAKFLDTVKKAKDALQLPEEKGAKKEAQKNAVRLLILTVSDPAVAKEAIALVKDLKPILNGANESNCDDMSKIATEAGVTLGVGAKDLPALYGLIEKLEAAGNKNLVLDVGTASIKDAFATAVKLRRGAIKGGDHSLGYPSLVQVDKLAKGDHECEVALASLFTLKYGSIILMSGMDYAKAGALYGLRQNIFTDPQKPMTNDPGVYRYNKADDSSLILTTVDFALTGFLVSGEIERSGVPVNMVITDAGGYSVLTSWAAGKLTATSISKFLKGDPNCQKLTNKNLIIPGKVAVLKGELEENLPGWTIHVGPREASELVKFLKDLQG